MHFYKDSTTVNLWFSCPWQRKKPENGLEKNLLMEPTHTYFFFSFHSIIERDVWKLRIAPLRSNHVKEISSIRHDRKSLQSPFTVIQEPCSEWLDEEEPACCWRLSWGLWWKTSSLSAQPPRWRRGAKRENVSCQSPREPQNWRLSCQSLALHAVLNTCDLWHLPTFALNGLGGVWLLREVFNGHAVPGCMSKEVSMFCAAVFCSFLFSFQLRLCCSTEPLQDRVSSPKSDPSILYMSSASFNVFFQLVDPKKHASTRRCNAVKYMYIYVHAYIHTYTYITFDVTKKNSLVNFK